DRHLVVAVARVAFGVLDGHRYLEAEGTGEPLQRRLGVAVEGGGRERRRLHGTTSFLGLGNSFPNQEESVKPAGPGVVPVLRPGLIDTTALRLVAPAAMLLTFSRSGGAAADAPEASTRPGP